MKKLFDELNAMIVEAIMQGGYDTVSTCDFYTTINVDGLLFNLWIANTSLSFQTYDVNGVSTMQLSFSDEQKKILFTRFRTLFELSTEGQKERAAYERLKAKYETN